MTTYKSLDSFCISDQEYAIYITMLPSTFCQMRRNHDQSIRVKSESIEAKNNYSLDPELGNSSLLRYIRNVQTMSESTSYQYHTRLTNFKTFVSSKYKTTVDDILKKINEGLVNPYELLSDYSANLLNGRQQYFFVNLKTARHYC